MILLWLSSRTSSLPRRTFYSQPPSGQDAVTGVFPPVPWYMPSSLSRQEFSIPTPRNLMEHHCQRASKNGRDEKRVHRKMGEMRKGYIFFFAFEPAEYRTRTLLSAKAKARGFLMFKVLIYSWVVLILVVYDLWLVYEQSDLR